MLALIWFECALQLDHGFDALIVILKDACTNPGDDNCA